ncbi:hypothetical protein BT93_L2214 [Corymbia citriodora subsp. variegata]|uniref:S-protein homolog n=1 Tax=Corymbia citriodora subsp. variegata TaxID=360336 RepID=A0A8T0CKN6_CORYI|nr:hypothetical protein BT93_L2214 [Corymbia citriodora subsp. variegata]
MKPLSQFTVVLFLSLFFISSLPQSQANNFLDNIWITRHVHIINDLSIDMELHCQSKDDDLGARVLHPGQEQMIRFRMHFFKSTLFYCDTRGEGRAKHFDVFVQNRDKNRCGDDCKWSMRDDGIYFSNDGTNWNREYTWG